MEKYVFLRINEQFRDFFLNDNLSSFLELYNRREESVFYKEQFRLFLEKNKQKEIIKYLKEKLSNREEMILESDRISISNKFDNNKESLIVRDKYLIVNGNINKSIFKKYLSEYDNDFLIIDINNNKIERLSLVN